MKKAILSSIIFLFTVHFAYAAVPLTKIEPNDKILIVAPHPDDATLAAAGVIQEALKQKAKVKILYITAGEHNIPALLFYKGYLMKGKKGAIKLGQIRRSESRRACKILGLKKDNLIFLDYPDSGILKMFLYHWGKRKPFVDSLTKLSSIEIGGGISPQALYKGEDLLTDIEKILLDYKPNKIFLPSVFDGNSDHLGSYLFLKLALLDLRGELKKRELYLYLVHTHNLSIFARYKSEYFIRFPSDVDVKEDWVMLRLSEEEKSKKKQAILKFKSQMYCKKFLLSFAQNELFEKKLPIILLSDKKSFNMHIKRKNKNMAELTVSKNNGIIDYRIHFLKKINPELTRGKVYLLGYKNKEKFKNLPKIYLSFRGKKWNIYNQGVKVRKSDKFSFEINKEFLELKVPISLIANPDFIFSSVKITSEIHSFYFPWRIIELQ